MSLFHKLYQKYTDLSLNTKMKLSYFFIAFIPLVSISLCTFFLLYHFSTQKVLSDYQDTLHQMSGNLDYKLGQYTSSLDSLIYNTDFASAIQDKSSVPWKKYTNFKNIIDPSLSIVSKLNPDFLSVTIYHDNPTLEAHRPYVLTMNEFQKPTFWDQILIGRKIWCIEDNNLVFYSLLLNTYPAAPLTVLRAEIRGSRFWDSSLSSDNTLLLLDEQGDTLWSNTPDFDCAQSQPDFTMLRTSLQSSDWTLCMYIPTASLYMYVPSLLEVVFLILLLCILIITPFSFLFAKSIVQRLTHISLKMKEIENGNLSSSIDITSKDEIGQLSLHFNRMANSLNTTMQKLYATELEKKSAENNALRAQITPHFLYNTLSMINWSAINAGNLKISQQVTTLSKFYRTALNHGEVTISLSDEFLNVQSYISLQQEMHNNSFSASYQINPDLLSLSVPTFILQPLAENAIIHGIDTIRSHTGKLYIEAHSDDSFLYITVSNTGHPFDKDAFQQALIAQHKSYGLKNVYARIYAEGGGSTLELIPPLPGFDTSIQIRLYR